MEIRLIKTDADYEEALVRIDSIMDANPDSPEGRELELLSFLVEKYEEEKYPIEAPDPISAIRFLMEQRGLKQQDLVPILGSKGKVSEVLHGKRPLSLSMIQNLVQQLRMPPEIFFAEARRRGKKPGLRAMAFSTKSRKPPKKGVIPQSRSIQSYGPIQVKKGIAKVPRRGGSGKAKIRQR